MQRRILFCAILSIILWGENSLYPVWAAVNSPYSLFTYRPYLEQGYNTRLGWQGWPVSIEDPHLYRHNRLNQALEAELEFGVDAQGSIHTQILKWYQPLKQIHAEARDHFIWFGLEASQRQISEEDIRRMLDNACQHEYLIQKEQKLFITLFTDPTATYLRVSRYGQNNAPALNNCN